ncbi:MAG: caspase family protein [Saprospiraceae bacterium]
MKAIQFLKTTFFLFFCSFSFAQADLHLLSNWEYSIPEGTNEKINKVINSIDGNIIAVGETVGDSGKDTDGLFLVIDPKTGRKRNNSKQFGDGGNDAFKSVIQNYDGTFTIVGYKTLGNREGKKGWIINVDLNGDIIEEHLSQKIPGENELIDIAINSKGEALAMGMAYENRAQQLFTVSISNGKPLSNRLIGNDELVWGRALTSGADDNFVLVGTTSNENRTHQNDIWLLKVDAKGLDKWGGPKFFGDTGLQQGLGITTSYLKGGYAVIGSSSSGPFGEEDVWLLKIDESGRKEWDEFYGGYSTDKGTAVIELSEGGYAIAGQTKSHMPKASFSILNMIITDAQGKTVDTKTQSIFKGEDDNTALGLVELFNGEDLVLTGSSAFKKNQQFSRSFVGAFSYKLRSNQQTGDDTFGNANTEILSLSSATFFDANGNKALEAGERGYYVFNVKNNSSKNLHDISGQISVDNLRSELDFWKEIKLGTIPAGKSKRLIIPVKAQRPLSDMVKLNVNLAVEGRFAASSMAQVEAAQVDPPKLIVSHTNFTPAANPSPGETVKLLMELTNLGGMITPLIPAKFILPPGVNPQGSASIQVPGIRPGEKQMISFYFTVDPSFQDNNITITFETSKQGTLDAVSKTLFLPFERSIVRTPQDEIYWVTPDPDEHNGKTIEVSEREVDIKVMALSDRELLKKNFSNRVNGRRPQGQKMDESTLSPPNNFQGRYRQTYSSKVRLEEGLNEIEIIYVDEDGNTVKSQSRTLTINYIPKDKPNLYVLSIGVEHGDLKYTVKDAKDFAATYYGLKDNSGQGFKKVDVRQLLNKHETEKINIQKAFKDLRNWGIKDGDLVVVFISSHGKILDNNKYVLMPSDYDPRYEDITAIDFNEDVLKQLRSVDGNKLVFIDACHSGIAGSRSFTDGAASKVMNDLIQSTDGLEIFASCSDSEFSYEDDAWNNGAFTKAILEAFRNEPVEIDGKRISADIFKDNAITRERENGSDGVITIEELQIFLDLRVPYLAEKQKGKPQHPANKSATRLKKNTGIFMVY